jgi:2-polyprenyl-3-methyl-5-hydroxy-6-metoxy-1,4-benzoquinol methylase
MSIRQWFPATDYRSDEDEIMENPDVSRGDFVRALDEICWVNRNLGGTAAILDTLERLCEANQSSTALRILDLGTGSADIPMAMAEWGRAKQRKLQITAVDLHPAAVEEAQARTASYPEIEVRQGNALALPDEPYSFDYVVSSMFMHHLSQAEAVELLRTMARLSRRGLVVNDLERHPWAWMSIRLLGRLTAKGHIFRHDSALSVLRGFQKEELEALCREAGLGGVEIRHRFPFRWVLVWRRTSPLDS